MSDDDAIMSQWVVYYNPLDFPGKYVLRRWDIFRDNREPRATRVCFVADSLEEVRKRVPPGFVCMPRYENDDWAIYEVWI